MSFLTIDHISKKFGSTNVLNDVSISIDQGDFLVLVGPSGCGKSTLLNILAGLEKPTSGNILIDGKNVSDVHPAQRDIAMVFQSYALYPNMSVRQNLSFGLEMHKVPAPERKKRIGEVAAMLQIEDLLERKPAALSGGQRQRVAMGRALVRRPKIFLFDEPLSNLDAKLRVDMRSEIKRLHQNLGATIVYVTHDQIEAMTLSTKIAVMNKGIAQQLGTADDIYRRPQNQFVAQFMGSPAMNMLHGKVVKNENSYEFLINDTLIPIGQAGAHLCDRSVVLGIRPEAILLVSDKSTQKSFKAKVDLLEPTGADCFAILSFAEQSVNARMHAEFKLHGQDIDICFEQHSLSFFDPENGEAI